MDVGVEIKNQYQVVEHIGRGGMADVWSARDVRLQRLVAIKTIAHGLSGDVDPVALFEREARTIASMEHPHILPIYDFGEFEGQLYIVMRYMPGGSLEGLIERGPMLPEDAVRLGDAIASALDYAHENKVIHLDLKPPNVLLDSSQAPYLADFGLATFLDPEGRARNPGSGTLLYMAPEQLTAELIDHRADIYSFGIVLYHMFTGRLPFDGSMSFALRQLQFHDELPDVTEYNPALPFELNDVLRRATSVDIAKRPAPLQALMEEVRSVIGVAGTAINIQAGFSELDLPDTDDLSLIEALNIYNRARQAWAGGNGRFILGVTHFMLMADYYASASQHGLEIDLAGLQMLLRGAIEYDYQLEYWWEQLNDENRRWVCLHAIRSGNAPARTRAFRRLETLPDDEEGPVIPRLVAQALEIETDETAKMAALDVLGTRARFMRDQPEYRLDTSLRGNLITSFTRITLQLAPQGVWREAVYSPEIDLLLADIALNQGMPRVADYAARIIGRIHSLTAVRAIANAQRAGKRGALRALAFVRDEAPNLPDVVTRQGRFYAWLTNTARRMADRPMDTVLRFVLALLAGWLAMGEHVYSVFRSQDLFTPQRWGNTIAIGLVFGLLIGVLVLLADQFNRRLVGFWHWWLRLFVHGVAGYIIGVLAWASFTWFFLQGEPHWPLMRFGGLGLAFGFVLAAIFNLRGWSAMVVTALATFVPLYASFYHFCQQAFLCFTPDGELVPNFNFTPIVGLGLLIGILISLTVRARYPSAPALDSVLPSLVRPFIGALAGLATVSALWFGLASVFAEGYITWDGITAFFLIALALGGGFTYALGFGGRWAFIFTAGLGFPLLYNMYQGFYQAVPVNIVAPPPLPQYIPSLLYYDVGAQIFTIGLPMAIVIAIGGHAQALFADLKTLIPMRQNPPERNGWLSTTLLYAMGVGVVVSAFSLFSLKNDIAWALLWVVWGILSFITAFAAWNWRRWGALGVVVLYALLPLGGLALDLRVGMDYVRAGESVPLFTASVGSLVFAILLGLFAYGALRKHLWGGLGIAVLLVAWFFGALFFNLNTSFFLLGSLHLALVSYALSTVWQHFATPAATPTEEKAATVTLKPALSMATELDVEDSAGVMAVDMRTELDAQAGSGDVSDEAPATQPAQTELDVQTDVAETELDVHVEPPQIDIDLEWNIPTPPVRESDPDATNPVRGQTDVVIDWAADDDTVTDSMKTEMDVNAVPQTDVQIEWEAADESPEREPDPDATNPVRAQTDVVIDWAADDEPSPSLSDMMKTELDPSGGEVESPKPQTEVDLSALLPSDDEDEEDDD